MYYGWVIVAVSALAQFIAMGTAFYSFGPLLVELERDLGATRAQVTGAMSLLTLVGILGGPLVGWLVDRGSVRRAMLAGALLFAIGLLALARVQSVAQLWLAYAVPIAFGQALLGGVANPRLIASWFATRRGVALGVAMMGVSVAGMVVPRLMGELVALLGWRGSVQALALLPVAFVPLLLLVADEPAARGLSPDGLAHAPPPSEIAASDASFAHVLRQPALWLLALCFALAFAPNGGLVVQVYAHAQDVGLGANAGWAVGAMAAGGGIGKPAYGWLADRFGARGSLGLALALMVSGLALLVEAAEAKLLLVGCAVFGLGFAGLLPLQAALAAQLFGREVIGRVIGVMGPATLPFTMGVHPFMAWVHDATGSYALAFQVFIASCALSGALLLAVRVPASSSEAVRAA
jgi:MFS family permease